MLHVQANSNENQELNLQKFAYTPRASLGSSVTPSSVRATPKIPATPSGRGWEHLDLYHQQRNQQYQEEEAANMNGMRQLLNISNIHAICCFQTSLPLAHCHFVQLHLCHLPKRDDQAVSSVVPIN